MDIGRRLRMVIGLVSAVASGIVLRCVHSETVPALPIIAACVALVGAYVSGVHGARIWLALVFRGSDH